MTPVINVFWVRGHLGPLHTGCIKSFLKHGHRVRLHSFEEIPDAPSGIEFFDATQLMDRVDIVAHRKTNSLALVSDVYRYRILKSGLGLYADCDVFCIKPIISSDYVLGWESDRHIGTAVLGMPPKCELLDSLLHAAEDRYFIPPWDRKVRRYYLNSRKFIGAPVPVERQKWGTIGPLLMTAAVKSLNLTAKVRPIDFHYPLHAHHLSLLNDPGAGLIDIVSTRTQTVHLWSSLLKSTEIKPGSLLDNISGDTLA